MSRLIGLLAVVLVIGGVTYSVWNLYQWNESKQSVQAIDHSKSVTVKNTELQPKKALEKENSSKGTSTLVYDYQDGEKIANLEIPKINSNFDVFWNTDDSTLEKGVGMYVSKWTTIPNETGGHTVVSGHRDTVFTELGNLEKGDTINVDYDEDSYTYIIKDIWITDEEDRTVIVKKDKPTLTLTTCYPFDYIGAAPDRYIIQAELE
ncbi:class D sortase [Metabacillus malikii]|uniref:Sortase A n=1 Tax=Metabacillus malikii TaxID=1504265 RepID=A0ABT9ZJY6_9BACI|nr:class D sortase [Metabacillus malikii]MDQ0232568.1 sortase A [Metabacillus malikii]